MRYSKFMTADFCVDQGIYQFRFLFKQSNEVIAITEENQCMYSGISIRRSPLDRPKCFDQKIVREMHRASAALMYTRFNVSHFGLKNCFEE